MPVIVECNPFLIGGALGLGIAMGAAVAAALIQRKHKHDLDKPKSPPTMQAGKVKDLVMACESWRDVRPYHLLDTESCRSPSNNRFHKNWEPMQAFGKNLVSACDNDSLAHDSPAHCSPAHHSRAVCADFDMAKIPKSVFGFRPYSDDLKGKPFKVYAGFHMTRQARLWRSPTFDRVIAAGRSRPVIIPSESGVTFDTIFQMILDLGGIVYVYGGVLRDIIMKGEHVADDIDVLFTCSVQRLIEACEARGWKEGDEKAGKKGDYYLKWDEKTRKKRFDYFAIGEGKEKFSGHTLDSNCAGEFAFNCLLYDVQRKILIDSSGWGLQDAASNFLRIPYDGGHIAPDGRSQWELWSLNCDRLPGMSSLRFFNFRSRGCGASPKTVEHCVRWLKHQTGKDQKEVARTMETFLKRKIMRKGKGVEVANQKLAAFKACVLQDFDMTLGNTEGATWWAQVAEGVVQKLRAELVAAEDKS